MNLNHKELLEKIKTHYIPERIAQLDHDFLEFEEDLISTEDLNRIFVAGSNALSLNNPYNSCMLYGLGLTDEFDFSKARSDTIKGSPPDIDIDFEAFGRSKALDLIVEDWGRDHVSNIMTLGTYGPKSLTRRYFSIIETEENKASNLLLQSEILGAIPKPLFGLEPTLKEIIEGNPEKGYPPHPFLLEPKYKDWLDFCRKLDDMPASFGVHAAGIVISDKPIMNTIPVYKSDKSERISAYPMQDVEAFGLIKFDLLSINNLDIIKECLRLIEERHAKKIDMYEIPDGDKRTYDLLAAGFLVGIFQFETSATAYDLITRAKPKSILELSDLSSLNRPGPLQYVDQYIENKESRCIPDGLPKPIAELLTETYYILIYQEQVMSICQKVAGSTLKEADDIRRAMGKKNIKYLAPYKEKFIDGLEAKGITRTYAEDFWDNKLIDFANYAFNKSHSIAYSYISYVCAYLKANYAIEFYTALMTIRSSDPKTWSEKAPEIIQEAMDLGIIVKPPCVQNSDYNFKIIDDEIYFGFSAIKAVSNAAVKAIITARNKGKFRDIWDFISRVHSSSLGYYTARAVTSRDIQNLAYAGAFDSFKLDRDDIVEQAEVISSFLNKLLEYKEHQSEYEERNKIRIVCEQLEEELEQKVIEAKANAKAAKSAKLPISTTDQYWIEAKAIIKQYSSTDLSEVPEQYQDLLSKYNVKKPRALKEKTKPELPTFKTLNTTFTPQQLYNQAAVVGCYIGKHPANIVFPEAIKLINAEEAYNDLFAGQIVSMKIINTKNGKVMGRLHVNDGTATAEVIMFPPTYERITKLNKLEVGQIISFTGKVESIEPLKMILNKINIWNN